MGLTSFGSSLTEPSASSGERKFQCGSQTSIVDVSFTRSLGSVDGLTPRIRGCERAAHLITTFLVGCWDGDPGRGQA